MTKHLVLARLKAWIAGIGAAGGAALSEYIGKHEADFTWGSAVRAVVVGVVLFIGVHIATNQTPTTQKEA